MRASNSGSPWRCAIASARAVPRSSSRSRQTRPQTDCCTSRKEPAIHAANVGGLSLVAANEGSSAACRSISFSHPTDRARRSAACRSRASARRHISSMIVDAEACAASAQILRTGSPLAATHEAFLVLEPSGAAMIAGVLHPRRQDVERTACRALSAGRGFPAQAAATQHGGPDLRAARRGRSQRQFAAFASQMQSKRHSKILISQADNRSDRASRPLLNRGGISRAGGARP